VKLRKDENDGLPKTKVITPEADPFPKENPNLGGAQKVRVDRSLETPGAVEPKRKGSIEMKPGGKTLVARKGAGKGQSRVALYQHFPDDDIYHALLKPDQALADGKMPQMTMKDMHGQDKLLSPEETYHQIIKTVHEPWHRAMANWMPLNKALSEGKVPKGVLAKSIVFAAMSPNTPVDLQEAYYGHYIDMLNEGKVDPFKPMSDDQLREFQNRATGGQFPTWNRDHYVHATKFAAADGTSIADDGEAPAVGELPQIQGLRNAHLLYPYLEHLTARHKDDTQGIAGELMDMKDESNRYNSAFKRQAKVGKLPKTNAPRAAPHPRLRPEAHPVPAGHDGRRQHDRPRPAHGPLDLRPAPTRRANKLQPDMLEKLQTGVVTEAARTSPSSGRSTTTSSSSTRPCGTCSRRSRSTSPAASSRRSSRPSGCTGCIGHHDQMRNRPSMASTATRTTASSGTA
jgi:hypothetical protein